MTNMPNMPNAINTITLGYRPFLDPIDLHDWWFLLLVPTALFISITWKAIRSDEILWPAYARHVAIMTAQIVLGMIAGGLFAFLVVERVLPRIVP